MRCCSRRFPLRHAILGTIIATNCWRTSLAFTGTNVGRPAQLSLAQVPFVPLLQPRSKSMLAMVPGSGVHLSETPVSSSSSTKEGSRKKKRPSRPERKARERASKSQKKQDDGKNIYSLHSNYVSILTCDESSCSTPDEVLTAIKRAQKNHDLHDVKNICDFLIDTTDETYAYGYRGALLSRLAVAALHLNHHVDDVIQIVHRAVEVRRRDHSATFQPLESAAIIRGLLRVHNVTYALQILEDELPLPDPEAPLDDSFTKELLKHRALSLASIASRHYFEGEPSMSVLACQQLEKVGPLIVKAGIKSNDLKMPWVRLVKGASQCESGRRAGTVTPCEGKEDVELPCNLVYSVLDAMTTFPSENSDRVYEGLSNALVRRVLFVTGAVAIQGCPPSDRGEVAFIGRSNVGKSSLVNMLTNRKALAYTSKRPGKTQQFNYLVVNDKPDREKELKYGDVIPGKADEDSFYLVDLPGFGYAKVPQQQRQAWADFFEEYISTRKTLQVLFHLVDSRLGATDEDKKIMRQVSSNLSRSVKYVVVLTKADKNVKGPNVKNAGKVSTDVQQGVRDAMRSNGVGRSPLILTSAETRLGRDDIWRYMRLAAEA